MICDNSIQLADGSQFAFADRSALFAAELLLWSVILSEVGAHATRQQKLKRALSRPFLDQPAVKKERVSPQYEEKGYTKHDITRLPLR
jgi:hypothetical protein